MNDEQGVIEIELKDGSCTIAMSKYGVRIKRGEHAEKIPRYVSVLKKMLGVELDGVAFNDGNATTWWRLTT